MNLELLKSKLPLLAKLLPVYSKQKNTMYDKLSYFIVGTALVVFVAVIVFLLNRFIKCQKVKTLMMKI